jgi:hypothetical protein
LDALRKFPILPAFWLWVFPINYQKKIGRAILFISRTLFQSLAGNPLFRAFELGRSPSRFKKFLGTPQKELDKIKDILFNINTRCFK